MGVDCRRLFADPAITCFISETVDSPREYLHYQEHHPAHGMALAAASGRQRDYGFMLHYCDTWGGIADFRTPGAAIMDDVEEDLRWEIIHTLRPPVFSFYSIPAVLVREGAWYQRETADRFWARVAEYKASFSIATDV